MTVAERAAIGERELLSLLALSMALAALGIDLMLPAFGDIRADLGLPEADPAVARLVTAYFVGLAAGQVLYGPLSDRIGRRPTLYVGYVIYGVSALGAALAPSLGWLLVARVAWGFGAAGPRVVTLAAVRDAFEGERMSRAMSAVMAVFIVVPVFAPSLGAVVTATTSWRWLFVGCVAAVLAMALWALRLPETLAREDRLPLRATRVLAAARVVVTDRRTVLHTLALTVLFGVFISYIGSAELLFGEVLGVPDAFPVLFGLLGAVMGLAMLTNGRVVERVGVLRLTRGVLRGYVVAATALVALALATGGHPPLWAFMLGLAAMLFSHALLIPNLNTLAMAPMGAVAGTASSVIGAVQLAGGALLGALIDSAFDGTVRPLAIAFLAMGVLAVALVHLAERGRDEIVPTRTVRLPPADT